jgi:hypothetical protein
MKVYFFLLSFSFLSSTMFAQRDTIRINNNWQFAIDKKG